MKELSTELLPKLLAPATEQRPRPLVRVDDGPTWAQSNQLQREEEAGLEQEAADKEAQENAMARILEEEKAWYWERKRPPWCLLAVPVGSEEKNLHWQTMKDPEVSLPPSPPPSHAAVHVVVGAKEGGE